MPEYLTPGVYIEEFEIGGRPIEGVGTSTAGFLGLTERGPTIPPKLVTSLTQFMRIFGGYLEGSYLPNAVDGFFTNGGQRCFIGRIARAGAAKATKKQDDVVFESVGEGSWGNRVAFRIRNASNDPNNDKQPDGKKYFRLIVAYWSKDPPDFGTAINSEKEEAKFVEKASHVEVFDNVSEDPGSFDHYLRKFEDPLKNISYLIRIDKSSFGRPGNTPGFVQLEEGKDDEAGSEPDELPPPTRDDFLGNANAKPGERTGLTAFTDVDEIAILYVPDLHIVEGEGQETLRGDILSQCEDLKDRFAILEFPSGSIDVNALTLERTSKYGAIYYPWIKVYDPLTQKERPIPPGGYVAGIYARSDIERGVHKAPANELVRGATDLEFSITKGEQGILNPRGINVIRYFQGRGILVWGARTVIPDPLWKYINVRRLFIYIEESIEEGTQWVVFEPNNEKLWARVRATITEFLTRVWTDGALMGTKPEEAFFVKCDRTNMTQDDIDNGRLICIIGIAPVKPAEFVIFRIAQWAGGSAVTE